MELGYEGNTTDKVVGTVFLCDINRDDKLELLHDNEDGNVTYSITETTELGLVDDEGDELDQLCLTSNLK